MKKRNKGLKNNEYSLSQLFSNPLRKIIIPDFQRDYCWGDKTHGENKTDIISNFLDTLIEEFDTNRDADVLLGKIDVYEHPTNYIYLTDGQQRLTSLYLLLGLLYRIESNELQKQKIKDCLITAYQEPRLQYAVRESTVFFLHDLILDFCLENKALLEDQYYKAKQEKQIENDETLIAYTIKNQSWYFDEYNQDPSILSMLSTLGAIQKKKELLQAEGFSTFLLEKIKIQYYDVQSKEHGEERFVIINTTGKSLTASENIKPILLANVGNTELANQWEDRETYFWHNRDRDRKEVIADHGVNDFLTWCFQIIDQQQDINLIKQAKLRLKENENKGYLVEIHHLFNALKQLLDYLTDDRFQTQFKFVNDTREVQNIQNLRSLNKDKQHNVLLPLLFFLSKFQGEKENTYRLLRRLRKNYFDLQRSDRNNNYVDWRYILQMIEASDTIEQLLQFDAPIRPIQNVSLNKWFNEEEKIKLELKSYQGQIEQWEDHESFMGDLSFLFQTNLTSENNTEIPQLDSNFSFNFNQLQKEFRNYQATIDLIKSEESAQENTSLANMFRLFRFYINCNTVDHIHYSSWDFEGVLFSTLNREHLFKLDFMKLLKASDLLVYCTSFIKNKIREEDLFNLEVFTVDKFIKAWLTLKVFYANEQGTLLAFYDGNDTGVSAYIEKDRNRLMSTEEFSLGNSICGFAVKNPSNYVHYTSIEHWCKSTIIDTPFSDVALEEANRTVEQIEKNNTTIQYIINSLIKIT